jgi:hypothetical protein
MVASVLPWPNMAESTGVQSQYQIAKGRQEVRYSSHFNLRLGIS